MYISILAVHLLKLLGVFWGVVETVSALVTGSFRQVCTRLNDREAKGVGFLVEFGPLKGLIYGRGSKSSHPDMDHRF